MNFLEQLAAEWYSYKGYFVRTNIRMNKRSKGGWDNELDVLAFRPAKQELIHVESIWDAESWSMRRERFMKKKFVYERSQYESLCGMKISLLKKVALVGFCSSTKADLNWGKDIEVLLVPNFIRMITDDLRKKDPLKDIIPEELSCLRAIQFALAFGDNAKKDAQE